MNSCRWPGCKTLIPRDMWGCKKHWFTLPVKLRERISKAWARRNVEEIDAAHEEAAEWVSEQGLVP